MVLPIRPWNEAAKCTMKDCQFSTTKKIPSVPIKSQNNVADFFFLIRGMVHYEYVPTGQTVNQVYYLEVLERLREKLDGYNPNVLPTTHESCITTMHLLTQHCL